MPHIDLHIHSCHSDDGDYTAEELVSMAKAAGICVMAIADHNTASAVQPAIEAGKPLGVEVIPAIELDCHYRGLPLHILGYRINHMDDRFRRLHESVVSREREASGRRVELVEKLGFKVDRTGVAALARNGVVTAEMIAEVLLADTAQHGHPLLQPYLPGGARADNPFVNFYWDVCANGKPAHVPVEFMSLADAIELITGTGGVPVLAHPGNNLRGREDALAELTDAGVRGVEAYSSYHSPEECRKWRALADGLGLFVTCGSDFHGKTKPAVELGGHGCMEEARPFGIPD